MPKIVLTSALTRWMPDASTGSATEIVFVIDGATVGEVFERLLAEHPNLRGYVVDDHGSIRQHVAVFVDGVAVRDKALAAPVRAQSEIYIMQALSGG
ncbi:MAG: MoaD/ThiS family protein [Dokdonella sp.]